MAYPISFNGLSDGIHRLRELADKYTPGPGTALSLMGGPMGWMMNGGATMPQAQILNNHRVAAAPVAPAAPAVSPSISTDNSAPAQTSVPALGGLGLFPPQPSQPMNWLQSAQQAPIPHSAPAAPAAPSPAPQAAAPAQTPMPMARPAEAPQATPDTGFFMRNALMMQDPNGGGFIDPQGASSVRGPDLIAKMMDLLHKKADA